MKRTLVLAVACAAVFALAACPSSGPASTSPGSGVETPSTTPASPASPAPLVVGDCTIEPATNCPDASLRLAVLHNVDLHGANLAGADLYGADLRQADLRDANLSEANLQKADLTGAHLDRANLTGAQLTYANLTKTKLTKATVRNGQFTKALLCKTTMPDGSINKTGCADSADPPASPTPTPTKTPKPDNKAPAIDKFNITPSPVVCHSKTEEKSVKVRFSVTDATAVQFQIDSEPPGGEHDPETKTAHLAFGCGDKTHTYTIIAFGSGSKKATDELTIHRELDTAPPN